MTQPQNKAKKCEHKNKRRWTMDLESGTRCDDCGADLSLKLSVSQPQLSVRERARKMFDEKFGYKSIDFHDGYDGDGWNGASMVKSAGCNDCAKCIC